MKNGLIVDGHIRRWYKDDQLHREDGPAIEYDNGVKFYIQHDLFHRLNGPALIYDVFPYSLYMQEWNAFAQLSFISEMLIITSGVKPREVWCQNNILHRIDGPAIIDNINNIYWYYHGERINANDQDHFNRLVSLKAFW